MSKGQSHWGVLTQKFFFGGSLGLSLLAPRAVFAGHAEQRGVYSPSEENVISLRDRATNGRYEAPVVATRRAGITSGVAATQVRRVGILGLGGSIYYNYYSTGYPNFGVGSNPSLFNYGLGGYGSAGYGYGLGYGTSSYSPYGSYGYGYGYGYPGYGTSYSYSSSYGYPGYGYGYGYGTSAYTPNYALGGYGYGLGGYAGYGSPYPTVYNSNWF
jgi:hypothetical protein